MSINNIHIGRLVAVLLPAVVILYLIYANLAPLGVVTRLSTSVHHDNVSALYPERRVNYSQDRAVATQLDDLIYLDTKLVHEYENSKVSITYKNPYPDQLIKFGFRDREEWHYKTKTISAPGIDKMDTNRTDKAIKLYSDRGLANPGLENFLASPDQQKRIGIFETKVPKQLQAKTQLPGYRPSQNNTVMNTPLRGSTVMYVYLEDEQFNIRFKKRDLNWYSGADKSSIEVRKDREVVFTATIDDDGNSTDNKIPGGIQTVDIKNPGPGLPENGIYEISIQSTEDAVITEITTNLNRVSFSKRFHAVDNNINYGTIVTQIKPTVLYSNGRTLKVKAYHEGALQVITAGSEQVAINKTNEWFYIDIEKGAKIIIPKSNLIIETDGSIALTPEQLFSPYKYDVFNIETPSDIISADYIITEYEKPILKNGWQVVERNFELTDAVRTDNALSWIIAAPDLKQESRFLQIQSINFELIKKGWRE